MARTKQAVSMFMIDNSFSTRNNTDKENKMIQKFLDKKKKKLK